MTVPAATYQRFQAIGAREDLENAIYNIAPVETPVVSAIGRSNATNTLHEWQTDTLDAAGTNRAVEGDDASILTASPTTRLQNYCQISTKAIAVSGTLQAADLAGRKDELSYQLAKRSKEIKRDIEYAVVQTQASSAGSATVPRSSAGMEAWIFTNRTSASISGTSNTTPGFSGGTVASPTDATVPGSVSETMLKGEIQKAWSQGGNPEMIVVGGTLKQKLSTFTGIATQYRDNTGTTQATILGAAAIYVSDFGEHKIVPCRQLRTSVILGLDTDYWSIAYYRPFNQYALAKTGDSEKRQMLAEWTLVAKNEKANFKISDINPAL